MEAVEVKSYAQAFAEGYAFALEQIRGKDSNPVLGWEEIVDRYGGKIGKSKAYEVINAVRRCCGGGMLDMSGHVMLSELIYWENKVNPEYVERL